MDSFSDISDISTAGAFSCRYVAFLETIATLRPSLHRYCSRMTGTVMDGEDIVQETLLQAYRKLDAYDDAKPWLRGFFRSRTIAVLIFCDAAARGKKRKLTP
jgi:RNA polymerase sigma-70 factor, ECF subfamily